ncbi:MAG: hypothetical protein HYU25_06525 [Candidatus Rokubacteria bacterium]|nr:hypothetical protein [Candidatus Rokubacteria bacterium]
MAEQERRTTKRAAPKDEPKTTAKRHLFDRTLPKWEDLRKDLDRFIWKHDYRNTEPFTDPEASSYRRAFEMLAGRRELWGSDVHGPAPARAAAWSPRRRAPAPTGPEPDAVDDAFERGRLELRVRELTEQVNETMSRAAALHYRLSRVAEDRDALELNLSGERGANELAMRTLEDLRVENERLRAELDAARRARLASRPRED